MEKAPDNLTRAQRQAVAARGNVLVMAGAGTGKTKTLVARCLDCLGRDRASLDELLIVTFTEAAAAEMRLRLRRAMEAEASNPDVGEPGTDFWLEQLARFDIAHIGTLHGFCLKLVREHFHELGLDPQMALLDEGEARQLADETLDEQFQAHYAGEDEFARTVQNLIQTYGNGRDEKIRRLVLRLHDYSQTRPDPTGWLREQLDEFTAAGPAAWREWLLDAITHWRNEWRPRLEILAPENAKALELTGILSRLPETFSREAAADVLAQVAEANATVSYPRGQAGKLRPALGNIFLEAAFLHSVAAVKNDTDPLVEDWQWVRPHMTALLRLVQEFSGHFSRRKSADGVLDFHDLEQFALKLLWNFSARQPTATAEVWRKKLRFIFVDEYQDINAAQDKIIAAISRNGSDAADASDPPAGNRFLVGDVKQSIYRFRLADPKIFRDYAREWRGPKGQTISLSDNFRSRAGLLDFANSLFSLIMHEAVGGVGYDADAQLKFGARSNIAPAAPGPRTELLLRLKPSRKGQAEPETETDGELADLDESTREARLIARRLKKLVAEGHEIWDDERKLFRAATFGDMAVLLRSPRAKAGIFTQEFEQAGIPLAIARGGFYDSSEILDLLSLLNLLDNPLQDLPGIAVLRSPLVGLSLAELAEVRLVARREHFWTALVRSARPESGLPDALRHQLSEFLTRFSRWRKLARQTSLSECLEQVLTETYYADWLKTRPRGEQRAANVERLLQLAQQFDQFQRQGLFRFLKFIEAQRAVEIEPDVPAGATENAVRLMSIHQSKGLEFPVVVVANLAKSFNESDLRNEIILDEQFGLCPLVKPPDSRQRYPSLPYWLAQKNQRCELRGEELRLLYVALTRARDTLILSASIYETRWGKTWTRPEPVTVQALVEAKSFSDWLALWFAQNAQTTPPVAAQVPDPSPVPNDQTADWQDIARFSLRWRWVADEELLPQPEETASAPIQRVMALDGATAEKLQAVLSWEYPHTPATRRKAKASVTELRRAADEVDEEAEPIFTPRYSRRRTLVTAAAPKKLNAAEIGAAHHKFLQHVALAKTDDLAAEAGRLLREQFLSPEEHAVLDLAALAYFWNSPLGKKIRAQPASAIRRELPFTVRFRPAELAHLIQQPAENPVAEEFVIVQGVADLAVLLPDEAWVVDFKTDAIRPNELAEKIRTYTPQLHLYAAALEKIFARKVTQRYLHFLTAHRTEAV